MKKVQFILILLFFSYSSTISQWVVQQSGINTTLTQASFTDVNTGNVIGVYGKIMRTTNGGQSWINQPLNISSNLWGIQILNANTGFVIGEGGTICRTTNGGSNWLPQSPSIFENFWSCYFINENTGFVVGGTGTLMKTTNSGNNWFTLVSNVTVNILKIRFSDPTIGYAVGGNGTIIKTTNSGNNWILQDAGITSIIRAISVINPDTAFICGDGGIILETKNGGINWTLLTSNTIGTLVDIFFTNSSTGTVVALENKIYRTTNAGSNWIQQINPTNQGLYGVYFVNNDTGYAVGDNGLILRTNTGGFSPPQAPNLISPVNGAQNVSITPNIIWDTLSTAQSFNLQLSLDSTFNSTIFDSTGILINSYSIRNGLLSNNIQYFWRVRGNNFVGFGPWSSIWKFTTIVAIPSPPILSLPTNGSSNISLHPLFDWDSTSPAYYYSLQAAYDSSFIPYLIDVDITGITLSQLQLDNQTLRNNTRYYWRVNATNYAGTGPWSAFFKFSTIISFPPPPILIIPLNGATNVSLTPLLKWVEDVSVIHYRLQISLDSSFSTSIYDQNTLTSSQLTVPVGILNNFTKYYWRVNTTTSLGTSSWSSIWNFTTILSIPAAPVLLAPLNGANNISLAPLLDWDDNPFSTYRIQLSADSTFNSYLINIGSLTNSQYQLQGGTLSNNTLYFWRVNATNAAGTGPWSQIWHFTTIVSAPIAPPQLIFPPNGASGISATPILDWNDVYGASGYKLQLSTDSVFTAPLIDSNTNISQLTIPNGVLSPTTTYYWRARGYNNGGSGPWSQIWHFTTGLIGIKMISNIIPQTFNLYYNYPNPFNPSTIIKFDIPENKHRKTQTSHTKLIVYDMLGRVVNSLFDGDLVPGAYEMVWSPQSVASGIYFYRLTTDENIAVKRMVYVK